MKKYTKLLFLLSVQLSVFAADYTASLKEAIEKGDVNQVNYFILNHGPFDRKIYDNGLLLAMENKNMELFNALSGYAGRTAHRQVAKLLNKN